jgi:putative spermidine/putrescine transport system permease protein
MNTRVSPWLLAPALGFVGVFFVLPVLALLAGAFRWEGQWGLEHFVAFFAEPLHTQVYWRTLRIALLATLVSAIVCYPAAMAMVKVAPPWRGLLTGLVILPLMVSPIARTYAWIVLLGRHGAANALLVGSGVQDEPVTLLFTEGAVFLGLLQLMMPLMLVSLVSALENLPADVLAAAQTLGANRWQSYFRVTLPLTQEGLIVGGTLVFTGCVTAYITPALLGGPKVLMLETLLYQKVNVAADLPAASVIAVLLLITTVLVNQGLRAPPWPCCCWRWRFWWAPSSWCLWPASRAMKPWPSRRANGACAGCCMSSPWNRFSAAWSPACGWAWAAPWRRWPWVCRWPMRCRAGSGVGRRWCARC